MDVFRHRLLVVAAGRAPQMPGTSIIGGDYAEATGNKRWDDAVPLPPGLREAMQEHDGARCLPGRDEMEAPARVRCPPSRA
jgi:hypothetical protein